MRTIALRLPPGSDVRAGLDQVVREQGLPAAVVVGAVGSLSRAMLRHAGRETGTLLTGDLELLTLSGTLGPEGCHLHAAVADATGAVHGGHVLAGCVVRTTLELVLGIPEGVTFLRRHDPDTGYRELLIRPLNPAETP